MIGRILSHYEIREKLGAGAMGEVYLAHDTTLDRKIALKLLPPEMSSDPERLARFKREAKAVAALNHPNIVTIHSVEECDGIHFLTMEYVDGRELAEIIPENGFTLPQFLELAIPLAEALHAAHERGITHRDVKPGNIIITHDGRVKVLDFGLAKLREDVSREPLTSDLTQNGRILGTVPYMSPEQLKGQTVDHRSDIFSLGVVLYEIATGRRPFNGESFADIASSILRDKPPPLPDDTIAFPTKLRRVLSRSLEKDVAIRYQSALNVRSALESIRRGDEAGAPEESGSATVALRPRRGRGMRLGLFGLAALLIAVVGYLISEATKDAPGPSDGPPASARDDRKMIVVLPFENLGPPEDSYFAAGITEEITSRLAAVSGLGVISHTSAFQYDKTGKTIPEIGSDLGVDFVLEGSVRWDHATEGGSRVRITPRLILADDDMFLWTERYDRVMEDIFAVQSAIAESIIVQLDVTLLKPEQRAITARPTENMEAYQVYLRGLDCFEEMEPMENIQLAAQMFEQAVALDPEFALAYAKLSEVHSYGYRPGGDCTPDRLAKAKDAVDRALGVAPDLPEAHRALGFYHYWGHLDYDRALEEFALAQARLPNDAGLLQGIAHVWRRQGRFEDAISHYLRTVQLNPHAAQLLYFEVARTRTLIRDYAEADRNYAYVISLTPDEPSAQQFKLWNVWLWNGDLDEARRVLEKIPGPDNLYTPRLRFWQHLYERDYPAALAQALAITDTLVDFPGTSSHPDLLAGFAYRLLDDPASARRHYDSARAVLETRLARGSEAHRLHSALGVAYAGLGRRAEAVREAELGVTLCGVTDDAVGAPFFLDDLAFVYVLVEDHEAALDQIERLLSIPSWLSVSMLRLDPRWDPLREHPRFRDLLTAPL